MSNADVSGRETLFWELARPLLAEPGVSQGTMMGQCQELKDSAEVLIAWGGAGAPG